VVNTLRPRERRLANYTKKGTVGGNVSIDRTRFIVF
jgi:hypothetical protein